MAGVDVTNTPRAGVRYSTVLYITLTVSFETEVTSMDSWLLTVTLSLC